MSHPVKAFQQALERQAAVKVAKITLDPKVIAQISRMTHGNSISESYVRGAEAIGAKRLAEKFKLIVKLVELEGHRPRGLGEYQYELYQEMLKQAEHVLDEASYQDFYQAF